MLRSNAKYIIGISMRKDITGQRFGKLTAVRPTDQRGGGCVKWECQCDCGNTVFVASNNLIAGRKKSCGCNRGSKKDITGQRSGKLTALRPTDQRLKDGSVIWECQCDCGTKLNVAQIKLSRGHKKSCGCKCTRMKDIAGQRFGMLTALRPSNQRRGGSVVWECLCDCGKNALVQADSLLSGNTKSCGCNRGGKIDISGQRFGKLTALYPTEQREYGSVLWKCQCDCGNTVLQKAPLLCSGVIVSCGCYGRELIKETMEEYKEKNYVEGTSISSLYSKRRSDNKSGVPGVTFDEKRQKWRVNIGFKCKNYPLGYYTELEDAVAVRKLAEDKMHIKFLEEYKEGKHRPSSVKYSSEEFEQRMVEKIDVYLSQRGELW